MSAHTPGPWLVTYSTDVIHNDESGVTDVAHVYLHSNENTSDANARLICAAPALLEALEQALRFIEVSTAYRGSMTAAQVEEQILNNSNISATQIGANSCNTLATFSFEKARAAIRQARGES